MKPTRTRKWIGWKLAVSLACLFFLPSPSPADTARTVNAEYLPSHCFTDRKINEFIHYAQLAGINGAVLHVKDPYGRIHWRSKNVLAGEIGSPTTTGLVEGALKQLKRKGFWTIAKVDVFADHQLVSKRADMGIIDTRSDTLWSDKNGLYWANPYNENVWHYNIALCKELASLGFDEIQFDYIRFPSDGELAAIKYPGNRSTTRTRCIGKFLETARAALKPLGVQLSVDVFGLVAWKTVDFGVGQLVETIAPHVDVICPMLYPSHFPTGFLGKKNPGDYPLEIMASSMQRLNRRTATTIRPWVQGFWYKPEDINAQFDGLSQAQTGGWSVWNPSGNYSTTYDALAQRLGRTFPAPQFYPTLAEISHKDDRVVPGNSRVVNLTNYVKGYSIVSLEEDKADSPSAYSTLIQVFETLDEGIMDQILKTRNIPFTRRTCRYKKKLQLANLLCGDLGTDPRRLRPKPIYIDWRNGCRFSGSLPENRLVAYRIAGERVFDDHTDVYASLLKDL